MACVGGAFPGGRFKQCCATTKSGSARVSLILESGERVTLRAPTTWWGLGDAQYDRDFHRIGQWWLAHRGQSWRPVRPEAPWPPVQGSGLPGDVGAVTVAVRSAR